MGVAQRKRKFNSPQQQITSAMSASWGVRIEKNNMVPSFGIPWAIVLDNGMEFNYQVFLCICLYLKLEDIYSNPAYPSRQLARKSNKLDAFNISP